MAVLVSGNLLQKFEDLSDREFMFLRAFVCVCRLGYLSILKQNKLEIEVNIGSLREHKQWKISVVVLMRLFEATE